MADSSKNFVGVFLAGGQGSRIGKDTPKQFMKICGQPMLVHSAKAFHKQIPGAIMIFVVHPEHLGEAKELIEKTFEGEEKEMYFIPGGKRRQDSVWNALTFMSDEFVGKQELSQLDLESKLVIIHDSSRPCVSADLFKRIKKSMDMHEAVITGVPLSDTIKQVDFPLQAGWVESVVHATIDRSRLLQVQTPQGFRYQALHTSMKRLRNEMGDPEITDDGMALEMCGEKVFIIRGEEANIKVTYPEDFSVAELILGISTH